MDSRLNTQHSLNLYSAFQTLRRFYSGRGDLTHRDHMRRSQKKDAPAAGASDQLTGFNRLMTLGGRSRIFKIFTIPTPKSNFGSSMGANIRFNDDEQSKLYYFS